jgi:diaminopimelate epimerase
MSRGPLVVKMSGAGNDFVVLDEEQARRLPLAPEAWARRVCRRGLAVGADGVLFVSPAGGDRVRVRFLNPDGSEAFCGNGTRCAARFARRRGYAADEMVLETSAGDVPATVEGESVRLSLPAPEDRGETTLELAGERLEGRHVVASVPHFVVSVDDAARAPLGRWGPQVRRHPHFGAAGTNLDVIAAAGDGAFRVRTWERGVEGETLACGSGAVAAAFALRLGGAAETLRLIPASGVGLEVGLPGAPAAPRCALLAGDARFVFECELDEEALTGFE